MPLLLVLQPLDPLLIIQSLGFANLRQHILNSRHHALEPAEVNVGPVVELGEYLVGVLFDLVLDVHLASLLVLLLAREGVIEAEVAGKSGLGVLEFVVVEEGVGVGDSEEEPRLSLVGVGGGGVLEEEAADESSEGGDSGPGGHHDVVGGGVLLGHEHDLSGGTGHHDFVSGLGVAEEVGTDSLLGGIVGLELGAPVGGATYAEGSRLAGHVVSVSGGGDGVEAYGVGLSVLFANARGNDSPGLSLPVGKVSVVVDDDVAGFSGGLGSDDALGGDDFAGEGGFVLVDVGDYGGLVVVGVGLEEVLLDVQRGSEVEENEGSNVWCSSVDRGN